MWIAAWLRPFQPELLRLLKAFELSGRFSGRGVLRLDALSAALRADPRVLEFDIQPRKD